jgi:Trypsin-co-occurring domain 1
MTNRKDGMPVVMDGEPEPSDTVLVPVTAGGRKVYLSVRDLSADEGAGRDEEEIASGARPTLDQALAGLTGVAEEVAAKLEGLKASRLTIEFGCEFVLESGAFVAVVGKATARSAFKVGLEWTKPT